MMRDMAKKRGCPICGKIFQSLGYASHLAMHRRERERETEMIINIIDDETIEVYGETAGLADENAKKFIKIAIGNGRWLSYRSQCGTVMDKAKLYKVIIKLTKTEVKK